MEEKADIPKAELYDGKDDTNPKAHRRLLSRSENPQLLGHT